MKTYLTPVLFAFGFSAVAFAAEPPPADVVIIDHAKVNTTFATGGTLLANSKYKVQAGHRDAPGQVEIHTFDTDIFYITEGSATIITGGTAADAKETAPGELRATRTTGGTPHQVSKGDVVVIPAGVPHWMPEVSKPFDYFVVKVTK